MFKDQRVGGFRFCSAAFTLIEILSSIVIVAVLAALLFPAIGKMTDKSRTAKCLSNLRQLGTAWLAYANDNGGRLASSGWKNTSTNPDYPGLRDYAGMPAGSLGSDPWLRATVFTCPVLQANPATATKETFFRTYGVNELACDLYYSNPVFGAQKRRLSNVTRPSQFAIAMDGSIAPGSPANSLYAQTCSNREGKEQWVQRPHGSPASKGANVLFADGHVALTEPGIILDTSATSGFWRDPAN
jgi:prepilin-type processing-associated H-X9-DG protein/prepilin-type N-terminal cleavage/methylation domain-containing protein